MIEPKPVFPITVKWSEDGEIEIYHDLEELECNLEWFDTDDPAQEATVTDKLGRKVRLKIEKLNAVDFSLAEVSDL